MDLPSTAERKRRHLVRGVNCAHAVLWWFVFVQPLWRAPAGLLSLLFPLIRPSPAFLLALCSAAQGKGQHSSVISWPPFDFWTAYLLPPEEMLRSRKEGCSQSHLPEHSSRNPQEEGCTQAFRGSHRKTLGCEVGEGVRKRRRTKTS